MKFVSINFVFVRIAQAKQAIDPDGMQIILRQPFLGYYFADELRRENNTLHEFKVIHFNSLPQSNPDGKVFIYGGSIFESFFCGFKYPEFNDV